MRKHVLLSAELIHINGSRDKLFNQGAVYPDQAGTPFVDLGEVAASDCPIAPSSKPLLYSIVLPIFKSVSLAPGPYWQWRSQ
jgi:hypothetical protein